MLTMLEEVIVIVIEITLHESYNVPDTIFTVTGVSSEGYYVNPRVYRVAGIQDRYFLRHHYQLPYPVKLTVSGDTVLIMESIK